MKRLLYFTLILASFAACKNGPQLMPNVSGKAGEVIVVADKNYWNTDFGAAIRDVLSRDYPALPQQEPLFNVVNIPQISFTKIFEPHRNIILLHIVPGQEEAAMEVRRDIYAAPQIIITLSGPDGESVAHFIRQEQEKIVELLEHAERQRVIENTKKYQNFDVRSQVMQLFGGSPYFPTGYTVRKTDGPFIWIAYDSRPAIQGVLVFSYPYKSQDDFTPANMLAAQNEILKAQVPSSAEGSYMTISSVFTPELRFMRYNDIHFAELRGLWEIENGYMGGPFISHSFLNQEGTDVIVLLAFVYAPGKDKRNFLRQTEAFLYSFEWAEQKAE
jgi:hypothetical protein